jgi:hypothetical protein
MQPNEIKLNLEKCNQMKSDHSKVLLFEDPKTCWDKTWKGTSGLLVSSKLVHKGCI